jgi:hypothetical protein
MVGDRHGHPGCRVTHDGESRENSSSTAVTPPGRLVFTAGACPLDHDGPSSRRAMLPPKLSESRPTSSWLARPSL